MRRWFIYGIIFFFLFIFGAVIYVFFLGGDKLLRPPEDTNNTQNAVNLLPGENQLLFNISATASSAKIVSAILSLDEIATWYFNENGQLFRQDLDGDEPQSLALPRNLQVEQVYWSLGSDFLLKHKTVEGSRFVYYNSATKQFVDLPANVLSVGWISALSKIIYVWRNADGSVELKLGNPDTSGFFTLAQLSSPFEIITSESGNRVILYQPFGENTNQAMVFDTNTGRLKLLVDRGRNTAFSVSPDGSRLIFSRINEALGVPELWLYDFVGENFANLTIKADASDVGWIKINKTKFIYAAGQPNNTDNSNVAETLYLYDTVSSASSTLYASQISQPLDYQKITVTLDGKKIIFIEGNTGKLYRLRLP